MPSAFTGVFMKDVGPLITNIVIIQMRFKSTPRAIWRPFFSPFQASQV